MEIQCFQCLKSISLATTEIGRREECPSCHSDMHVCKNCEFYDVKVYNECRESQAEVCREKDRANFCDFFRPKTGLRSMNDEKAKMMAAAEALFKKK